MTQPTWPRLMPMRVDSGERERRGGVRPMHGQQGEGERAHQLRGRLASLVEPQAPPVMDLDVVVEVPDEAEGDHDADGEVAGAREADLGADVPDGVSGHDGADDGDAAHRRRAGLGHVGGGPVLPDVLADLAVAEVADEDRGEEDGDPQGDAARDEQSEHVASGLRVHAARSRGRARRCGRHGTGRRRRRAAHPGARVRPEPRRQGAARLERIVERHALPRDSPDRSRGPCRRPRRRPPDRPRRGHGGSPPRGRARPRRGGRPVPRGSRPAPLR